MESEHISCRIEEEEEEKDNYIRTKKLILQDAGHGEKTFGLESRS
jgi:hypothetical protein